jgi:hypothetical protein
MDEQGFPARLDLFKAMASQLAIVHATEIGLHPNPSIVTLGKTWLHGYLKRHPALSSRFAADLDHQCSYASNPIPIKAYFNKLRTLRAKYNIKHENIFKWTKKDLSLVSLAGPKSSPVQDDALPTKHMMGVGS